MNQQRPRHFYLPNFQQGLSLVELMISITLGLFLIWGVTQSFLASKQTYRLQQGLARIQENGRMAQEFIGYDIRNAGDYGCGSGDDFMRGSTSPDLPDGRNIATCGASGTTGINMIAATTSIDDEFEYAVYGFDNVAASTTLTATSPAGAAPTATLSQAPKAGTDVLMVHVSEDMGILTAAVGDPVVPTLATPASLTLNTTVKFTNTLTVKERMSVSDCASTKVFGVADMTTASATVTLADNYCNKSTFQQRATVRKLNTIYYFVSANGRGGFSLYRQTGGMAAQTAQELLEGVEDMQLEFGVDNVGSGDGVVDVYKTADAAAASPITSAEWNGWDWVDNPDGNAATADSHKNYSLVRSVRYSLLMRTDENNVLSDQQQVSFNGTTLYGGNATAGAGDRRLRQVFTGTVGIRSRVR